MTMLTVFYSRGFINEQGVGMLGALPIVLIIFGALIVAHSLHRFAIRSTMLFASSILVLGYINMVVAVNTDSIMALYGAYALSGLALGVLGSNINAFSAASTTKGRRYGVLSRIAMLSDIVRIALPAAVAFLVSRYSLIMAVHIFAIMTGLVFLLALSLSSNVHQYNHDSVRKKQALRTNVQYRFLLLIELLDSLSSSQLVVYLPLLFLAKGFSLEDSLLLQASVFAGYLVGRWFIGRIAAKRSGLLAVSMAEILMICIIGGLLIFNQIIILYVLSFLLGVGARGTSPVLKAMVFDSLESDHVKRGTALYMAIGDGGSALGQLAFGLLIAWLGVQAPFVAAAAVALMITILLSVEHSNSELNRI